MALTHKVYSSRSLSIDSGTYVGEAGRLFYEQTTGTGIAPVLKYSDGSTPGGLPLSGSSLTFSGTTAPLNPHEGLLWWSALDGRLYIYYDSSWVDASPESESTGTAIVGYSADNTAIQPMSYNNSTGQVTYGQLNYAHFQGFPRLPNFSSDTAANAAIAGQTVGGDFYNTPQRGQMYYNTTTDKAMVYTASGWQAMN